MTAHIKTLLRTASSPTTPSLHKPAAPRRSSGSSRDILDLPAYTFKFQLISHDTRMKRPQTRLADIAHMQHSKTLRPTNAPPSRYNSCFFCHGEAPNTCSLSLETPQHLDSGSRGRGVIFHPKLVGGRRVKNAAGRFSEGGDQDKSPQGLKPPKTCYGVSTTRSWGRSWGY